MATYKVLQDIEAEDKFVGPLTLKQFILAGITLVSGYIAGWLTFTKGVWFPNIVLLPVMLVSGFLAFPWGRDQPTEVWLLAKLRFMLKPRLRIWDQTGMQELVTITAPKRAAEQFTSNNLSQTEVRSRLKALANTIDSRGWAVKNVNVNLYAEPGYGSVVLPSDRLVNATTLAPQGIATDITASDDIMDEQNNSTAQQLDKMLQESTKTHRQDTLQHLQDVRDHKKPKQPGHGKSNTGDAPPADYWFMNQPKVDKLPKDHTTFDSKTVHPGDTDDGIPDIPSTGLTTEEKELLQKQHDKPDKLESYGQTKVVEPLDPRHKSHTAHSKKSSSHHPSPKAAKSKPKTTKPAMTQTPDPAILNLAKNNDLSVGTVAKMANKKPDTPDGEVVISWR